MNRTARASRTGKSRRTTVRASGARNTAAMGPSGERFHHLAKLGCDWFWEQDARLRFVMVGAFDNAALGRELESLIGKTPWEIPRLQPLRGNWDAHRGDLEGERSFRDFVLQRTLEGDKVRMYSVSGDPVYDRHAVFIGYRGIGRDVTRYVLAQRALRDSEQRFRDIANSAGEYVWEVNASGTYTFVSDRVREVLEYDPAEMLGREPSAFMPADAVERFTQWRNSREPHDGAFRDLEHQSLTKSGKLIWQRINGVPIFDEHGNYAGYRGTGVDITERKLAEQRTLLLATRDALTGLANRLAIHDRLAQEVQHARRTNRKIAVLFVDLDRFKIVNDSLGHAIGDGLLREVAKRLIACVRESDLVGRLGGDEFIVGLFEISRLEDAAKVARKVLLALGQMYNIEGHVLSGGASIGIAVCPGDGDSAESLLQHGDVAMYHAKQAGRNRYEYFDAAMNAGARERLQLERDLQLAFEQDDFILHYQPLVDAELRPYAVEALVRWSHAQRGVLGADYFVPVAEETGFIKQLGRWVLRRACAEAKRWSERADQPLRLALNLSPAELRDGEDFVRHVKQTLRATKFDPRMLELEITESLLMQPANIDVLHQLAKLGLGFSIDDFGTGYSCLSYLKDLPIQALKIDRSFVSDLTTHPRQAAIVETIIAIGQKLGLRVIAEGIESLAQLAQLRRLGCREFQGYLFSKPVPAATLEDLLLRPLQPSHPDEEVRLEVEPQIIVAGARQRKKRRHSN